VKESAIAVGALISHYQVTGKLGAGGMGEVYRARDSKLNREVAIKVLPEAFAQDDERVSRFKREAQVLASLNHPHIHDQRFVMPQSHEQQTTSQKLTVIQKWFAEFRERQRSKQEE